MRADVPSLLGGLGAAQGPQKLWDKWCKILHSRPLLALNFMIEPSFFVLFPCFIQVHDIIPCFPKRFDLSQIITSIIDNRHLVVQNSSIIPYFFYKYIIVYLDETWVNQNHCTDYMWLPNDGSDSFSL
jgi:hypothetical protein